MPITAPALDTYEPIRDEIFSTERLEQFAAFLAGEVKASNSRHPGKSLLPAVRANHAALVEAYQELVHTLEQGDAVPPAAEWIVDNFHIVDDQVREILQDLPEDYYRELPKLGEGALRDFPRVYAIALSLLAHTDSRLDPDTIRRFLLSFQEVDPLEIGELWAVAIHLRIALIENLRRISSQVLHAERLKTRASRIVDHLLHSDEITEQLVQSHASEIVALLEQAAPCDSPLLALAIRRLRDQDPRLLPLLEALEHYCKSKDRELEAAIRADYQQQSLAQATTRNIVQSMRLLSTINWEDFVESVSWVDRVLSRDPAGAYSRMSFETRNRYRSAVERIAKRSGRAELEVAAVAVELAERFPAATQPRQAHVGTYLVAEGLAELENKFGYKAAGKEAIVRAALRWPRVSYFGSLGVLTALGWIPFLFWAARLGSPPWLTAILGVLALVPASDLALNLLNVAFARLLPVRVLAKLDYKLGIPADSCTLVVVPVIFSGDESVREALEDLEIRYIANQEENLRFAILGDFPDADEEHMPGDAAILLALESGLRELNQRHSAGKPVFYGFHRARAWSETEGAWLGWERKRGKLAELNHFLLKNESGSFVRAPERDSFLSSVRFVITLDADTTLPRDCAKKLVATILHPLNAPETDPDTGLVIRGYGVLQPRVSIGLESSLRSRFASLFSGHTGVDPYTTAVSDTYQDLFGAGIYTGKGLYVLKAFERALEGRAPEGRLLSHDLFEGEHARAALVSDIELLDSYPARYASYSKRQHRWTRGDWQILEWLLPTVPGEHGKRMRNPLGLVARWKIFDNLRRSLVAPSSLALLFLAWSLLPGAPLAWTAALLAQLLIPVASRAATSLIFHPRGIPWTSNFWNVWGGAWLNTAQTLLVVSFLPHQAYLQSDAIVRTLWRRFVSGKKMLEWSPAAAVERGGDGGAFLEASPALAAALFGVAFTFHPERLPLLAPLLAVWIFFPAFASWLSRPSAPHLLLLSEQGKAELRALAERTWSFFERYVGDATNWLPPDNVQLDPKEVVAERTSPTNIGLLLLSTVAARELGFLTSAACVARIRLTLASVGKLERYHGHLLNWYDTASLRPLEPRYVSTVDSGNLAGHLIAVRQALLEIEASSPGLGAAELADECRLLLAGMDFRILFDEKKKVFSIGLHPASGHRDDSYYDLLASEARLASFVAICLGQVPQEHWFHLGRQLTRTAGQRVLVSWSASMFEYLMPLLVMRQFPNTLLHETVHGCLAAQIDYGARRGVPWGVSESGYNARDLQHNYQYGPFGVPGLGLKRGLRQDLVISPYSTLLAAQVNPAVALENLRRMSREGWEGEHGFFEAVDFTVSRLPPGRRSALIRSYMAHHQGMSLCALANALTGKRLQGLFHADPCIAAGEALLQERMPKKVEIRFPRREELALEALRPAKREEAFRRFTSATTGQSRAHLLSNGSYSVMLTPSGTGYSRCNELAVTRWNEDPAREGGGTAIYLRDTESGRLWTATLSPAIAEPEEFETVFSEHRADFSRSDGGVHSHLEIVVSPEDDVELRQLTLSNRSGRRRVIEVCSYLEPVLMRSEADQAHPAFGKLFFETELFPSGQALLGRRRPRSSAEKEHWAFHLAAGVSGCELETDRLAFLGRNGSPAAPAALSGGAFPGHAGNVLDPVFAIRTKVELEDGASVKVCFATGVAASRDEALRLIDRYHEPSQFEREADMAWTRSQMELRHLNVSAEEAALYQEIAGVLLFSNPALRAPADVLRSNRLAQPSLWAHGISGDVPIVMVKASSSHDLPLVLQLLRAHEFLRSKRLGFDLVVLNDDHAGYRLSLHEDILYLVRAHGNQRLLNQREGVFILRADVVPPEERQLVEAVARAVFNPNRGTLREQVRRLGRPAPKLPAPLVASLTAAPRPAREPEQPRIFLANGYGGFCAEGREYVIRLEPGVSTPAPWSNVVANELGFGFLATESGGGYTWSRNSRENKLTPWCNDPVLDPPSEAVYLRDDETGEAWCPAHSSPSAEGSVLVRHGQGYSSFERSSMGIEQCLTLFVPRRAELKVFSLRLRNVENRPRRLSAFFYAEWVLGPVRVKSAHHVRTGVAPFPGILACNPFDAEFGRLVAFAASSAPCRSLTADRREFLGAGRELPAGLAQEILSGRTGPGLDPCAAIQLTADLAAGEEKTLCFFLGQAASAEEAAATVASLSRPGAPEHALQEVMASWEETLTAVTVRTPDPAVNFLYNRWLLYQTLSCRVWGRTAFYQAGGAFGFRDQLQDVLALLHSRPDIARAQLVEASRQQFPEGDVLHWWHPPSGRGVRTHISDDLVWLPYCLCAYVRATGDETVLGETTPFLVGPALPQDKEDNYFQPGISTESATIFEHCRRALDHASRLGAHGLPLIGGGDWNDGLNRVGHEGRGESVWLAWFLGKALLDFAPLCERQGESELAAEFRRRASALAASVEREAWDGAWYRRAYFDDGTPLGSREAEECQIDSIAQSWAVISGLGDEARALLAMKAVGERLVKDDTGLVLLFTPPFERSSLDPGYIKGYVPGIRENGGQYTHAAIWSLMAYCALGDRHNADRVFRLLLPTSHSSDQASADLYKVEPYVVTADIYGVVPHVGRGGWSWYTGSASWLYRAGLESVLGLVRKKDSLCFAPCLPLGWDGYELDYRFGKSLYRVKVEGNGGAVTRIKLDGRLLEGSELPLVDDAITHDVRISFEKGAEKAAASAQEARREASNP